MEDIKELWIKYNEYSNKLSEALGRTNNIVGEYAEHLAHQYYGGELLPASEKSADLRGSKGKLYQIKARKLKIGTTSQLGIIRSWNFDYLVVYLFEYDGSVNYALEYPVDVAKEFAKQNEHQNGYVISTTKEFLEDPRAKKLI